MLNAQSQWWAGIGAVMALGAAYGGAWLARWAAPRLGWVDRPDGRRKLHQGATPLMGGVAVTVAFAWCGAWFSWTDPTWRGLIVSAGLLCGLGLWDDRFGMRPRVKFVGQLLSLAPFLWSASQLPTSLELFGWTVSLGAAGLVLVALWLMTSINMINLADGLDGAASAVAITSLIAVLAVCPQGGGETTSVSVWSAVLLGAVGGFLIHNLPPARIFLGDAGSMTLGFLAGALLLLAMRTEGGGFRVAPAVAVLFVPTWDMLAAMARRWLQGQSIGLADRGHIHHRLRDHGLSTPRTLFVLTLMHGAMAATAAMSFQLRQDAWCVLAAGAMASGFAVGGVFGDREWLLARRILIPQRVEVVEPAVLAFPSRKASREEADERRAA